MKVETAEITDFESLIELSKEVEDLFGPMANEDSFKNALKDAIKKDTVFCIRNPTTEKLNQLKGGVAISKELNAILWFVVSEKYRRQGIGSSLLKFSLTKLDSEREITVQTFDKTVKAGLAARNLYLSSGFVDLKDGGNNPAGIPTVIMQLTK